MQGRSLIVAIRGWTTTGDALLFGQPGGEIPASMLEVLRQEMPGAEVWAPAFDLSMFEMRSPDEVASELFGLIDSKIAETGDVDAIVLLGYSAGSILARRVFCAAHGACADGSVDPDRAAPWAHRLHRLVVMSGITRGWQHSTASPAHVRFLSPVLFAAARAIGWWKGFSLRGANRQPFIWQLKRGAPFVISTRLQYVEVMKRLRERAARDPHPLRADGMPSTVFLLGAKDEYISPADCTELGPRAEFAFVELKGSNHARVLKLVREGGMEDEPVEITSERRARVVAALSRDFAALQREDWALPPGDIDDYLDPMDLTEVGEEGAGGGDLVQDAVMVVHGIRDHGFWTKRVAREVKTQARRSGRAVRAPSPSYGFFSMWDFVRPMGRQAATYWFMERYADVRSHFPNADISFVGHSNGTYIAANAMKICPAVRFKRVVFAGSVVRRDYPWGDRMQQVRSGVLNYVGSADGVVAFLPAVFEFLRLRFMDVGGAGAFGFRDARVPRVAGPLRMTEVRFVDGGHGAAIDEQFWPEIAAFVLEGRVPERHAAVRTRTVRALFALAPVFTVVGVALALSLLALPLIAAAGVGWVAHTGIRHAKAGTVDPWLPAALADSPVLLTLGAVAVVGISIAISWIAGRFLRAW